MNSTTRSMAVEYGQFGIRVNAVVLGLILTNENSKAMVADDVIGPRIKALHLTRLGEPEDMANATLFLASDEAAFITGSFLVADGGLTINSPLRSEEHTSELPSLMRKSYAVFCLKKKNTTTHVYKAQKTIT